MKFNHLPFTKSILFTFAAVSLVFLLSFKWVNNQWKYNIASDGKGYYVYLPAAFIYHDFSYAFTTSTEPEYYPGDVQPSVAQLPSGQKLNKYFAGEALLLTPFFLIAYALSWLFHFPVDGYSFIFQAAVSVAALFYCLCGLWLLSKFLSGLKLSDNTIAFTLLLVFAGSNLLHYTWMEPSMSHVYSFFSIAAFLSIAADFLTEHKARKLILLFIISGIICLIRPVNVLVILLLPFICFLFTVKRPFTLLIQKKLTVFTGFILFISILCIQLYLYKLQIGSWWIWAYANEGFNFSKPHFIELLFSFRKGWFVYTPVAFLSLATACIIWRKNLLLLFLFITPVSIIVYVVSSWHDWAYGASYGCRPMTEFMGLMMIPFAMGIQQLSSPVFKAIVVVVAWCFLLLNCIQIYQINKHILLWDNMTFESYKSSFLKTSEQHVNMLE